jgi:hypothetical protein
MKRLINIILTCSLVVIITANMTAQKVTLKPYGVASAVVDYKYSGATTGLGTLYFDDYGQRSNLYMDVVEMGNRKRGYTLTLGADQYMYSANPKEEGIKMQNPIMKDLVGKQHANVETITKMVYGQMGFQKTGAIIFLDKECEVWTGDKGFAWIWKGIVLKMKYQMRGQETLQEATAVTLNAAIDEALLKVPENVEFTEMPTFSF